ncbi:hypothetical protein Hamer_G001986 [Homarus americanus]|uniref:Uncharacterized protein n=1 Tax=Homarus americanus TaxID=6706 RepID=A0A8J5JWS9_HOMAM|nr:hypothetical protein Hamer_G001986 [Homarus americanus]
MNDEDRGHFRPFSEVFDYGENTTTYLPAPAAYIRANNYIYNTVEKEVFLKRVVRWRNIASRGPGGWREEHRCVYLCHHDMADCLQTVLLV